MSMVKKSFIAIFSIWIAIIVFAPKKALYYELEKNLKIEGIVISGEKIHPSLFGLDIENANIYLEGEKVATISSMKFLTLLVYNKINIDRVDLSSDIASLVPVSLKNIDINYAVWKPFYIYIKGDGNTGRWRGYIDLKKRDVLIRFMNRDKIRKIVSYLHRDKKGWYYEERF